MKNILNKFHISNYTYLFLIICFLSGYIKNIMIIFIICIFHELGHIILIKLFKYKINYIEILPFGGYTSINKLLNSSINKELIISLGGIINQVLLFGIMYIFKEFINLYTYNLFLYYNGILIFFNLLPIIPLDGSKIINLFFDKFFSYKKSYYLNGLFSIIFLIIFLIINIIYNYDNYFIILFLLYKLIMYIKDYKYIINRFLLERYLYVFDYREIKYNTVKLNDLKKEAFHYFNSNGKVISEKKILAKLFDKGC